MSDNEKYGAPEQGSADLPAAAPADAPAKAEPQPAEIAGAAVTPAASSPPAIGSFGSTRGSGLARGKRPIPAGPSAAPAAGQPGYKPTSIEVIAPASEYKNPFTGETSVSAPRANEPASQAAPAPSEPAAPALTSAAASAPESTQPPAAESAEKLELKILPPEQPKRAQVRWESEALAGSGGQPPSRRDERPTFRPDRERRENREPRSFDPREPRDAREPREPREPRREEHREERRFEPRSNQPYQERRPEPEPAKKGFVGWLKGIFGGKPDEPAPGPASGEPRREGEHGHRHRHRGGRGRHGGGFQGENRGPRSEGQQGGGQPHSGEPRGEGDFGGGPRRRRRRRGGRGRHHGEPRPEGQQGGGAI